MKKLFNKLLLCLCMLALAPLARGQLTFTTNNGAITITGYNGPVGRNVVIPASTNGYPVVGITASAFWNDYLASLTIPNSITNIGSDLFGDSDTLTNITVSASNPVYGSLNGVLFDKALTALLQYPMGLTNQTYVIPNGVTNIGSYAFALCLNLTSVTIPTNVTVIGNNAFGQCQQLTNATIPNSVTTIGRSAFSTCTALTSVTIPSNVTSIGTNAFGDCTALTSLTISSGVVNIDDSAFSSCSALTSLTIPSSVTSIGQYAFEGCTSLTNVTFAGNPPTPTNDTSVFQYDNSAVADYNPATTTGWGSTFDGIPTIPVGLTYTMNNGAATITGYAQNDFGLTITIPAAIDGHPVVAIGQSAFQNSQIAGATIPDSVTNIGDNAFLDSYLESVTIGNSVISIGNYAFSDCFDLGEVSIPDSVISLGAGAFSSCMQLQSVTIGNNVTSIGNTTFAGCNLRFVNIPNSVTNIGNGAFLNCALESLTIPTSVTSIGSNAFQGCTDLTTLTFLGNAPTPTNDATVFQNDSSVVAYYIPHNTGWGSTFDGIPTAMLVPPAMGITAYSSPAVFFPTDPGTDFVLQMSTNLASGNWATVTNGTATTIVTNGTSMTYIAVTNLSANAFFRLH